MKFFVWNKENTYTLLKFWKNFAWALIYNDYIEEENSERRESKRKKVDHQKLVKAPPNSKTYVDRKWEKTRKKEQKYKCRTVKYQNQICTYCIYTIGHWIGGDCVIKHLVEYNTLPRTVK